MCGGSIIWSDMGLLVEVHTNAEPNVDVSLAVQKGGREEKYETDNNRIINTIRMQLFVPYYSISMCTVNCKLLDEGNEHGL
jgi:hypothetical protein